jgi:hypothetical protein
LGKLPQNRASLTDVVANSQSGFVFHALAEIEVAFRDPVIRFFGVAIMHGRIINQGSGLELVGLADWLSFLLLYFSCRLAWVS